MSRAWVDPDATRQALEIAFLELEAVANQLRNALVTSSPRDSGRLANSWSVELRIADDRIVGGVASSVQAGDTGKYLWALLTEGTGRYGPSGTDIVPVRRQALRWRGGRGVASPSGAGYVFATRSRGSPPNPFVSDSARRVASVNGWKYEVYSVPGERIR